MVSGLYSGISQSQLSTSESLRLAGIVTCGVCSADFLVGAVLVDSRDEVKKLAASAAERVTAPAANMNLALITQREYLRWS